MSESTMKRVATHAQRLKVKKMKEIVKGMNAKDITIEELTDFIKNCPNVEQERRDKLDKHRKARELREKRQAGLAKARKAKQSKDSKLVLQEVQ